MADGAALCASDFPALLRATAWPVEWQPVWGEQTGLASRAGDWAVRGALAAAARLPEPALDVFLDALAALALRCDRRHTRAAQEFLVQALGPLDAPELAGRTRQAWRHFLRLTVDSERFFARVPFERTPERFEVQLSDDARAALRAKRGCVVVSGHLGNWEAGVALAPWVGFHPFYGVARAAKNRYLSQAMQASRERRGVRILNRKGAMSVAPAVLAAGGTLGLVVDQRASGRALLAPFFGRLARCDRSPAVLLKRHDVPVLVCTCLFGERPLTYRFAVDEVLWPEEWARADVGAIVLRINQALERAILAHPEQYVWIHDRYKDTPRELGPGAGARVARGAEPDARPAER